MKILWHSEITNNTGFAIVSRNLIQNLKTEHEITVLDWTQFYPQQNDLSAFKYSSIQMDGWKKIGAYSTITGDPFGYIQMEFMNLDEFDCIFILNDIWHINEIMKLLKYKKYKGKVVCYFPVDAIFHSPEWYANLDIATAIVTYTEFAKQTVLKAAPELPVIVIPHGIDTDTFFPIEGNIRKNVLGTDKHDYDFIFLNANRNQPRKRLDITMAAFAKLAHKYSNVTLYMHCGNTDSSMNIRELAKRHGISGRLIMTDKSEDGIPTLTHTEINMLYNICDVGLNSSMGEGWGLTNTEMASIGKPQIVPNHSACAELFQPEMLINIAAPYTFDNTMTIGMLPDIEHMSMLMEKIYLNGELYKRIAKQNIEMFRKTDYLWSNIAKKWNQLFYQEKKP